jgi:putative tryptophan/tyrosine transport system substrate-binding protein
MPLGQVQRREFILGIGSAAALSPRAGLAQAPARLRRIGVLMHLPENSAEGKARIDAFWSGFEKLGWSEGRNVRVDVRWTGGNPDLAKAYAAELVDSRPDVLLAGNSEVTKALRSATPTIPIVFAEIIDPISYGLVASLARPGGNMTGFMMFETSLAAKWLELLKQMKPEMARLAVMYDPTMPSAGGFLTALEQAAAFSAVPISATAVRNAPDIERFFATLGDAASLGAIELPGSIMAFHRKLIIGLAIEHRLPMVYGLRDNPVNGGLASYGVNSVDLYRQSASYVDRILKGEVPMDLPVQAADRYELVINLKSAKAIGLELPPALLARADEVIE